MAKVALKGFFERIEPVNVYGEKLTRIQKVIFRVPGYTDAFGDKKSEDEFWRLDVMGERIDTFDLINKASVNPKASIMVWINSKVIFDKLDVAKENPIYIINATLSDVEYFD